MDSLQEAFIHPPEPCEACFIIDAHTLFDVFIYICIYPNIWLRPTRVVFSTWLFILKNIVFTYLLLGRVQKGRVWRTQTGRRARASGSQRRASSTSAGAVRPYGREACSGGLTHSPSREPSYPGCRVQPPTEGEKFSPGATHPGQSQNEGACAPLPSMIHSSQLCSDGSCCHIKNQGKILDPSAVVLNTFLQEFHIWILAQACVLWVAKELNGGSKGDLEYKWRIGRLER